jgi:micrococcal nuclease
MQLKKLILIFLIISSGILYYDLTEPKSSEKTKINVTRVIDGDTFEDFSGQKYRLKGINTPEKSQDYYEEAKEFLKSLENNSAIIENNGRDRYGRILAHVFKNNQHINEEILKKGLGTLYYYDKDKYYKNLEKAESSARKNQKGIWKKSPNENCLTLIKLKEKESPKRCTNNEQLILENSCNNKIEITFKDDATHIYKETLKSKSTFTKNFSCIFNNDGDSLYVWDEEGLLIFYRY